jgi:hypothetical protein
VPSRVVAGCCAGVLVLTGAGCAPRSPDDESWSDSALQALDDMHSELATMRLVLEQARDDRVTDAYAQVLSVDSEEAAGKVDQGFGSIQPPDTQDAEFRVVTTQLGASADLLTDVRIAVVREEASSYAGLERKLTRQLHRLDAASRKVTAP